MAQATTPNCLLIISGAAAGQVVQRQLKPALAVDIALSHDMAVRKLAQQTYDVIIIAGSLAERPAPQLCYQFRHLSTSAIIIGLLDRPEVDYKIALLDTGADACLTQPINFKELSATALALLRRHPRHQHEVLRYDELELDTGSRLVSRRGQFVALTPKQFALLECLMRHAGRVVTREILTSAAWDTAQVGWNPTIDVHMSTLRAKIDRHHPLPLISTVRGYGYRLSSRR